MALRHSYANPVTAHFFTETLRHSITVTPLTGQNDCGEAEYGDPIPGVRCYISSTLRQIFSPTGATIVATWEVLFDKDAPVSIGTRLTNGVDWDGLPLLESAAVQALTPTISPDRGLEGQSAF